VIKRGTECAIAGERDSGRRWSIPIPHVNAVDSSGGGDAFLAGFLSKWLAGGDIEACLRRGVELGARAVTRLGGRPPVQSSRSPEGHLPYDEVSNDGRL
jgi:sugar/nucleoside kinase (ribokinase family)